ncbi:MAG: class I SAM-dependent methyltransferase [Acidobacteria bacterium]|nr:class I SAM-dependent methyltransferase [Acidobacteriota bacterium]
MGCYAKYVLPRLIDLAMRSKDTARLRKIWIPMAKGDVLELQRIARRRIPPDASPIDFIHQSAEDPLPLANASIDTTVLTWTLCSIGNPSKALAEVRRVLKPGGQLIFIEHGAAPNANVAVWQDRLTPVWKHIGGGCHLNRPIDEIISQAGFRIPELKTCYLPGPRPMTYTYQRIAVTSVDSARK